MSKRCIIVGQIVAFIVLLFTESIVAQEGQTFNTLFSPADYITPERHTDPMNWGMVQDHSGMLYVANTYVVMQYDGQTWREVKGTVNLQCRKLAVDQNGRIFTGGLNDLGYLETTTGGAMQFRSLKAFLPDSLQDFKKIYHVHSWRDKICFSDANYLFLWDGKEFEIIGTKSVFSKLFILGDELYAHENKLAISKLEHQQLKPLPHTEELSKQLIKGFYYRNDNRPEDGFLVITKSEGLWELDRHGARKLSAPYADSLTVYNTYPLNNHDIALGTAGQGLWVISNKGKLVKRFYEHPTLEGSVVIYPYMDQEQHVWLGLSNGLAYLEYPSPVTFFDKHNGLSGIPMSMTMLGSDVYIGTQRGLFILDQANALQRPMDAFLPMAIQQEEIVSLINYGTTLLFASPYGVTSYDGQQYQPIYKERVLALIRSKHFPDRFYAGGIGKITALEHKDGQWSTLEVTELGHDNYFLCEDKDGHLWVGYDGLTRLTFEQDLAQAPQRLSLDSTHGFGVDMSLVIDIANINNKIYFGSDNGLYQWRPATNQMAHTPDFKGRFLSGAVSNMVMDGQQRLWINHNNTVLQLLQDAQGEWLVDSLAFVRASKSNIVFIHPAADSTVWVGTPEGLLRYDPSVPKTYTIDKSTLIREVLIGKDSSLFKGHFANDKGYFLTTQPADSVPSIPHALNHFTFRFSLPSYESRNKIQYSYQLEGQDANWSEWTKVTFKEYTNLNEGAYTFKVKARNVYGYESLAGAYRFKILPPWYRTTLAYIAYFVLFVCIVLISVRLNDRRLRAANVKLQESINAATLEIRSQKEEIEEKNKNITSSIVYAKEIQTAVLPTLEDLQAIFPECFIYYAPKDVVSGDFYWFRDHEDKAVIIAADCTGHGVPGALVSMIFNTMLNKTISEQGILEPAAILNNVDKDIREAMGIKDVDFNSKVGMDIAICVIDKKTLHTQFAGAYNPMYIVRKDGTEVEEVKANRFSVAGYHFKKKRSYVSQQAQLHPGDCFYIFSDGYADQFNAKGEAKFGYRRFRELLVEIHHQPMEVQAAILKTATENWRQGHMQIDDMVVIGVRV